MKKAILAVIVLCAAIASAQTPPSTTGGVIFVYAATASQCQAVTSNNATIATVCVYGPATAPGISISINGATFVAQTSAVTSVNGQTGAVVIPPAPVQSVNGQTGAVTIPAAPVTSVNGKVGAVVLAATTTVQ